MKLHTYSAYKQDTNLGKDVFGLADVHFHMKCFAYTIEHTLCNQN